MKKLLAALSFGAFAFAHGPVLAQNKAPEPIKEEVKKAEAAKGEAKKSEPKNDSKKKVKKGGC